jgi:hypothetical protein
MKSVDRIMPYVHSAESRDLIGVVSARRRSTHRQWRSDLWPMEYCGAATVGKCPDRLQPAVGAGC